MSIFKKVIFLVSSIFLFVNANAQQLHAHWDIKSKKVSDCEYDVVFSVKIDEPWHMYSIIPVKGDGPNPTSIKFTKSADYELVGKLKESKPKEEQDKVFEVLVKYFEGEATFTQRVKALKAGKITISGKYEYQVCTDAMCEFPPSEKFSVSLDIPASAPCIASGSGSATSSDSLDSVMVADSTKRAIISVLDTNASSNEVLSAAKPAPSTDCNPWETLLLGLGFGLGAVLMPCIYSLIPLTVSFFLKQSKTKSSGIKNALLYGFFIILIFVALTMGITLIFGPTALSNIATNTWLNLFFFALFVVFALSFFGLFEITLPSSWANKIDAKADRGGLIGIFFMALTLVVVSFSCTVGFMGGLLTAVARGDSYVCPLMGFTGFGVGIALPFMLFAVFPSWLKSLPKSGGWMTTFKVTIAFLELALAVKFLANADNVNEWGFIRREIFIALWIGIFSMLTFYLLGVFRTSHDDAPGPLSVGRILWATIFMSFTIYLIPGMWGAPLKLISSFPPPHYYAEAPEGFGSHSQTVSSNSSQSANLEMSTLEKLRVVGPDGLRIFKNDYESALKYAKLVNKPLFVDFTGNACVNCRLMESTVWVTPEVFPMLRDSVVIVSLYVDSRVALPQEDRKEVMWYGKKRSLETMGEKWAYLQTTKYSSSSQPQYVVLNHMENTISNGTKGTETDEKIFAEWLKEGIVKFRNPAQK